MTRNRLVVAALVLLVLLALAGLRELGWRPRPPSVIDVRPDVSRFVNIAHTEWQLDWAIQLPETIDSREFLFMSHSPMHPRWQKAGDNFWDYVWRGTREYFVTARRGSKPFADGLMVSAQIESIAAGVRLKLTLANETTRTFHDVSSDGGCLQAKNPQFIGEDEAGRSQIMHQGRMTSLTDLERPLEIRGHYMSAFKAARVDSSADSFWGTSSDFVESPVIVGAVSRDGDKVVAIGYEGSWSALQNSDDHHCIHSNPYFGALEPGESKSRTGFILFGDEIEQVADELARLLREEAGQPRRWR